MRGPAAVVLVLATLQTGIAGERRSRLDVIVPVEPHEHERLHFPARDRSPVPGTVTINRPAYVCDLDGMQFTERDAFTAHLQREHAVPATRIRRRLETLDGRVHYVGPHPGVAEPDGPDKP